MTRMGRPPETGAISESRRNQRLFIMRERLRRNLIRTQPGETICLQYEEVSMLLKWIKELEKGGRM